MMSLDTWAHEVLSHYPALLRGPLVFLGNHGGFSGAHLWRLNASAGAFCLKAWPADWRSPQELAWIHALMAQAAACPWMPHILPSNQGASFVALHGRLWEIATWMPGQADFAASPSVARLEAACMVLAQLHQIWKPPIARNEICPALKRRLASWQSWQHLLQTGWRPTPPPLDPYQPLAGQLWQHVQQQIDVSRLLAPWLVRAVPLQPCVCDPWHDHILYTGNSVTGLIDYGSVKEDHVAVDLARLLGSMIGADMAMWEIGIAAYQRVRPLSAEEQTLAHDLDRTGTILAATHWLRWLYHERRTYERPAVVCARLAKLASRLAGLLSENF